MSKRKNVSASTVRAWALSEEGNAFLTEKGARLVSPTSRGRFHPSTVAAFRQANPSLTYEEKVAEGPRITLALPAKDSRGRNITRKVTYPRAEVNATAQRLGVYSGKGRLSGAAVEAVVEALAAEFAKVNA